MADPRVFLGAVEIAGVLWDYRCGLRKLGVDAQLIVKRQHRFKYDYDEICDMEGWRFTKRGFHRVMCAIANKSAIVDKIYRSDWARKIMLKRKNRDKIDGYIQRFDIFHFRSGGSLVPYNIDVQFLKDADKKIVMSYWGCDSCCTSTKLSSSRPEKTCFCKISGFCRAKRSCRFDEKVKKLNYWAENADVTFSGVPNSKILDSFCIPYNLLVIPINTEHWKKHHLEIENNKLLVVHAPSSEYKGTSKIIDTVTRLQEKHDFDFKLLQNIPNKVMFEWLNIADIVIDQFGLGWYGRLSVESMALGNPTLSYVKDEYKEKHKQFSELPIINITPDTLYDRLEELVIDPQLRKKIGRKSRKYVEKIHSSDVVCKDLLDVYRSL